MAPVSFAVVGFRNFATEHIKRIRMLEKEGLASLKAVVVEEWEENQGVAAQLEQEGVIVYKSYGELLEKGRGKIDIITLPTSIHTHFKLASQGMEAGYNLVLEKPPVPTVQQLDKLIAIEKETGTFCSVGFQMIHSRTIRQLKEMILQGDFGEIKEMTCRGYWPRTRGYYNRNSWAGQTILDGQLVLDGPIHNALAHYLNNMLFLAGPEIQESAELSWVRAELYKSRPFIASDDTSCLELATKEGVKIYFYVTHSSPQDVDPVMEIVGTKAVVRWEFSEKTTITYNDGRVLKFDNDGREPWTEVMRIAALTQRGDLPAPYSTLANSRSFVVAFNGAYDSAKYITPIPAEYLEYRGTGEEEWTIVKDIMAIMDRACAKRQLISDLDVPWARRTAKVSVENYTEFNPFAAPEYNRY